MNIYSYSEAKQNLSKILDKVKAEGKVFIKSKDGSTYEIRIIKEKKSPLDIKGVKLNLNRRDILDILREVRTK